MDLSEHFLVLAAVFLIMGTVSCTALGARHDQEPIIQDIIKEWTAIERGFIRHSLYGLGLIEQQFFDRKNAGGGGKRIFVLKNLTRLVIYSRRSSTLKPTGYTALHPFHLTHTVYSTIPHPTQFQKSTPLI